MTSWIAARGARCVDALVNSITSHIQPDAWDNNGGPGSITRIEGNLVVSQKRDVHEEIHHLLAQLRAALPKGSPSKTPAAQPRR